MITEKDKITLEEKGISEEAMRKQLDCFKTGFPYLHIHAAASAEAGIMAPTMEEADAFCREWNDYLRQRGHKVVKFVPASGAASRMFKNLFAFANGDYEAPKTDFEKHFFDGVERMAFAAELDEACRKLYGRGIAQLKREGRYKDIARALLNEEGLNYGGLPKGLLKFHSYADGPRTPFEEHLVEGALYAKDADGNVNIHFTISSEHRRLFEVLLKDIREKYEKEHSAHFNVSFSEQSPSTDTIAVNPDNTPFRTSDGKLLFRPGGHGSLIKNLGEIDADVIFIKNIDNVVPDRLKADTVRYKTLLAGVLVDYQAKIFRYLEQLESGHYNMESLRAMLQFLQKKLWCKNPSTKLLEDTELAIYLKNKFDRPLRVCGMVRNTGEAGGGPFLAYNPDGTYSPQILESSQIDMADAHAKETFEKGTHFNPVDLVCAVRRHDGRRFDLQKYVDPATGFISSKSKEGRELKALEHPGLWNGSMSDWNTVFVEVPLSTFNPVKTVNDLLRPQHSED